MEISICNRETFCFSLQPIPTFSCLRISDIPVDLIIHNGEGRVNRTVCTSKYYVSADSSQLPASPKLLIVTTLKEAGSLICRFVMLILVVA